MSIADIWGKKLGLYAPIMENEMESQIEHKIETGFM